MAKLHLSRVAYGCTEYDQLQRRMESMADGRGLVTISTRNKPKRAEELIGGSLYFIIKHMLMGRIEITAIESGEGGRHDIICKLPLERVRTTPKRAHQGWRYLTDVDAPEPLNEEEAGEELPPHLLRELTALKLI